MTQMEDNLSYKVICSGGLMSDQNYLDLADNHPGAAMVLYNFEPSLFGGYRKMNGYLPLESLAEEVDSAGAEGRIFGVAIYDGEIIAARKQQGSAIYSFYRWNVGVGWTEYVTGLTLTSTGVVKIRYATFNFDGTEKIIFVDGINNATIFDGTTWTRVDPADTGADYANAGGNQAIAAPKYVTVFKNHIFISGDASDPHIVSHSAPNAEYDWTTASGGGQVLAGFAVNQIKPFRESNYVFGVTDIKKIDVDSTGDFVINNVTQNLGCLASDTVQEIGGDLIFLSQDGYRPISGTSKIGDVQLETVSRNIQQDLIDLIDIADLDRADSVIVRRKSQYRVFFSDGNTSVERSVGTLGALTGSLGEVSWQWSRTSGIRASCCTSGYINGVEYVIHGDFNGGVYRQEQGSTFNGEPISSVYTTPYYDFGDINTRKTLRKITLFLRPEGNITISTRLTFNWDDSNILNPMAYPTEGDGGGSIYGTALYGTGTYSARLTPILLSNVQGSGQSAQLSFLDTESTSPYSIQAIVFEYTQNGRK